MHATAHSKASSRTRATSRTIIPPLILVVPWEPSKVSRRCPATMLAANRIAKVMGRIIDLTVSISTITGINPGGVPCGTKCAITLLNWRAVAQIIPPSQRGRDNVSVNTKCLEGVKIYGNRPIKLSLKIKKKNAKKNKDVPGRHILPNTADSSAKSIRATEIAPIVNWFLVIQKSWGINKMPTVADTQLNLNLIKKILAWGSKEEKRLPI